MSDLSVIQCNLTEGTPTASEGSRAYVLNSNPGGGHERVWLLIRSRGARWIHKWEDIRRLNNFRLKTIPPEHPLYDELSNAGATGQELVDRLNAASERSRKASE